MSGWLPPGCTDKDIDDAAPQNDPEDETPLWFTFADSIEDRQRRLDEKVRECRRAEVKGGLKEMYEDDLFYLECLLACWVDKIGYDMVRKCAKG